MTTTQVPGSLRRSISNTLKGSAGNLVEWYDVYVYTVFATYFEAQFFDLFVDRLGLDPSVQDAQGVGQPGMGRNEVAGQRPQPGRQQDAGRDRHPQPAHRRLRRIRSRRRGLVIRRSISSEAT